MYILLGKKEDLLNKIDQIITNRKTEFLNEKEKFVLLINPYKQIQTLVAKYVFDCLEERNKKNL
jgi:hypothetical protein